jgi:D-sedoheptulose 7-phosphate isomerase
MPGAAERVRREARFREQVEASIRATQELLGDLGPCIEVAQILINAYRANGQLFLFGNGGSAADAQHMAAEIVGRFQREREALAALALTTDTSILTAVANDDRFERVFARQIEALGRRGDVAHGISTSGRSPSVVLGLEAARARGLTTIALTGRDGGVIGGAADVHVNVPDESTARIQEVHRTLIHAICELIEG